MNSDNTNFGHVSPEARESHDIFTKRAATAGALVMGVGLAEVAIEDAGIVGKAFAVVGSMILLSAGVLHAAERIANGKR